MYVYVFLDQLQHATSEGVPVDGNFLWSAQDNIEWVDGCANRMGLICFDFETLERKPPTRFRDFSSAKTVGQGTSYAAQLLSAAVCIRSS
jgi:beta-glucosidase